MSEEIKMKMKVEKALLDLIHDELNSREVNPEMLRALAELYIAIKI